jgi:hypothetical protein
MPCAPDLAAYARVSYLREIHGDVPSYPGHGHVLLKGYIGLEQMECGHAWRWAISEVRAIDRAHGTTMVHCPARLCYALAGLGASLPPAIPQGNCCISSTCITVKDYALRMS